MLYESDFSAEDGTRLGLLHDFEDDSRAIVDLAGNVLLRYDSSCYVYNSAGTRVGHLNSGRNGFFVFDSLRTDFPDIVTPFSSDDYHWDLLAKAEMFVAKAFYDRGLLKVEK